MMKDKSNFGYKKKQTRCNSIEIVSRHGTIVCDIASAVEISKTSWAVLVPYLNGGRAK